jgi:MFS family permease
MSAVTELPVSKASSRGLGWLFASTGISVTGDGMLLAAAPLMAAALSRDPLAVASVSAASYAAWLLLGLPAGALVDRWDRRSVMIAADVARAFVLACFVVLVLVDFATIGLLAATVFLVGVGSCFFDPAAQAVIPRVVGRDKVLLGRANGRLWATDTFGRSLAGPPLGAVAFTSAKFLPFGLDAVSFLASAALVSQLPPSPGQPSRRPVASAAREGIVYLFRGPELRVVTFGMAIYNLGYNLAFATLVLYAQEVLAVSTAIYGLLVASMALGGIVGGWIAPRVSRLLSGGSAYALTLTVQGFAWLVVFLFGNIWLTGLALVCVGVASTISSVVGGSIRQLYSPDDMIGRVVSTTRLLGIGSAALGAVLGGVVADAGGLRAPFYVAAGLLLLGALGFVRR